MEVLDCTLCFEHYNTEGRRPKVLECGHTFCLTCLEQLLSNTDKHCPHCRTVIRGVLRDLKDNFLVLQLVDTDCVLKSGKKIWCEDCQSEAASACVDNHNICGMKKALGKKLEDANKDMAEQLRQEVILLDRLLIKLETMDALLGETTAVTIKEELRERRCFRDAVQMTSRTQLRNITPDPLSLEETVRLRLASLSRVPLLKLRSQLLDAVHKCRITVEIPDRDKEVIYVDLNKALPGSSKSEEANLAYSVYAVLARRLKRECSSITLAKHVVSGMCYLVKVLFFHMCLHGVYSRNPFLKLLAAAVVVITLVQLCLSRLLLKIDSFKPWHLIPDVTSVWDVFCFISVNMFVFVIYLRQCVSSEDEIGVC